MTATTGAERRPRLLGSPPTLARRGSEFDSENYLLPPHTSLRSRPSTGFLHGSKVFRSPQPLETHQAQRPTFRLQSRGEGKACCTWSFALRFALSSPAVRKQARAVPQPSPRPAHPTPAPICCALCPATSRLGNHRPPTKPARPRPSLACGARPRCRQPPEATPPVPPRPPGWQVQAPGPSLRLCSCHRRRRRQGERVPVGKSGVASLV